MYMYIRGITTLYDMEQHVTAPPLQLCALARLVGAVGAIVVVTAIVVIVMIVVVGGVVVAVVGSWSLSSVYVIRYV